MAASTWAIMENRHIYLVLKSIEQLISRHSNIIIMTQLRLSVVEIYPVLRKRKLYKNLSIHCKTRNVRYAVSRHLRNVRLSKIEGLSDELAESSYKENYYFGWNSIELCNLCHRFCIPYHRIRSFELWAPKQHEFERFGPQKRETLKWYR